MKRMTKNLKVPFAAVPVTAEKSTVSFSFSLFLSLFLPLNYLWVFWKNGDVTAWNTRQMRSNIILNAPGNNLSFTTRRKSLKGRYVLSQNVPKFVNKLKQWAELTLVFMSVDLCGFPSHWP